MNTRHAQQLLRGLSLVVQEAIRLQGPEATARAQVAQAHLADVLHKLPQAVPSIMSMRAPSAGGGDAAAAQAPVEDAAAAADDAAPPTVGATYAAGAWAAPDAEPVASTSATSAATGESAAAAAVAAAAPATVAPAAEPPVRASTSALDAASVAASQRRAATSAPTIGAASSSAPAAAAAAPAPAPAAVERPAPAASAPQPAAAARPAAAAAAAAPAAAPLSRPAVDGHHAPPPPAGGGSDAAAAAASTAPPPPSRKREFRERKVPASQMARVWGFGSMAASMLAGAAGEAIRNAVSGPGAAAAASSSSPSSSGGDGVKPMVSMSQAQAERLAEGLCRMRGAALKIGQMLSIADENMLPPAVAAALERVRTAADIMPGWQLERVLSSELGPDWRARLGGDAFGDKPIAAASIGQVHRAVLPDGTAVAVKVQYPGVAESINSDLANLKTLMTWANVLPKGLYMDQIITVARDELTAECDYTREAAMQERFRALVGDDPDFDVPSVVPALSTRRVLTTTWLEGMTIDQVVERGLPQHVRDRIARKLLKLTLKELFVWRFMQTDPNWGNFFYNPATDRIGLLDFGACRSFDKAFVDDYLRLVWAAANNDRATIEEVSVRLGFLTGYESRVMLDAHVDSGLVVGEPFRSSAPFDFRAAGITSRVSRYGSVFAEHRLTPPPNEAYSLHRKLAGAFLICIRMGAVMRSRDLLEEVYFSHNFGPVAAAAPEGAAAGAGQQQAAPEQKLE